MMVGFIGTEGGDAGVNPEAVIEKGAAAPCLRR